VAQTTQLNIRVEPALRDQVIAVSRRAGVSMQEWVTRALDAALAAPAPTGAQILAAGLQRELAQIVSSGDYQRWVDELDDPDVA
jgi:hypothetical protein